MYAPINELTEILRPKQPCDFKALFERFSEAKKAFAEIVTG